MKLFKKNKHKKSTHLLVHKLALGLAIALFTVGVNAQDGVYNARAKGNIMASGGILAHYTSSNVNNNKSTSFTTNITPKAGYFIMDNLAVGLEFSMATSNSTVPGILGDSKRNTTALSVGAFGRYYLDNGLFVEGLAGVGTKKTSIDSGLGDRFDNDNTTTIFGFRGGIGYAIGLGDHVALEPTINYSWEKNKPKGASLEYKDTLSSIFLGIGFTVFL